MIIPAFLLAGPESGSDSSGTFALGVALAFIPAIWIGLSAAIRRLHDLDWSGWWVLLSFIPLVSMVQAAILLFVPGDVGTNRFGPSPV